MRANEEGPDAIHAVGEGIDLGDDIEHRWQVLEREERAREEEHRHDEEVHDELEALHVVEHRGDGRAEGGEEKSDEEHEEHRPDERAVSRPEAEDDREHEHD